MADSRIEQLLEALLSGNTVDIVPHSRNEELLLAMINGETPEGAPLSRMEAYFHALAEKGMGSGDGVVIKNQNKTFTENGTYKADSGYTGLGTVTVNVPTPEVAAPVLTELTITENGEYTPNNGVDGFSKVVANIKATGGEQDHTMEDALITGQPASYSNDRVKTIADNVFYGSSATSISCPNVTKIGTYTFAHSKVTSLSFPLVTSVGTYVCRSAKSLTSASFPLMPNVAQYMFIECSALADVYFPLATSILGCGFMDCKALTHADFPLVASIADRAFRNTSLKTLVLRANSVCTLITTTAFDVSPFASGGTGGTVYVPAALVEQYKTATNWSTLYAAGTCNFVAIEGSEYE